MDTNIIKTEMSVERQRGYRCPTCLIVNIVYGDKDFPVCINCSEMHMEKVWDHVIKTKTTVESTKL